MNEIFCHICNKLTIYTRYCDFGRVHLKSHNVQLKEYYDNFLKKHNEGNCKICSNATKFISLTRGYTIYCSSKCRSQDPDFKTKWYKSNNIDPQNNTHRILQKSKEIRLIESNVECLVCNRKFLNFKALAPHLISTHKISIKNYYDTYLKKEHDGICKVCGKETRFWNLVKGYMIHCSLHSYDNPITKQKLKNAKENYEISAETRLLNEDTGRWIKKSKHKEFRQYFYIVMRETYRWKKQLFESWDGIDYYTNKKLISNLSFKVNNPESDPSKNSMQPTIDHKISIFEGFKKKINPYEIGHLNNLCICSRQHNATKGINRLK